MNSINFNQISRIKAEFNQAGVSVSDWARANDFEVSLVYAILSGKSRGLRGKSHEIALKLGLKSPLRETMIAGLLPGEPAFPDQGLRQR
ncbi:DNA-binding protein [Polaromonas sp.]|uniref:DNA-binding protein n=1 Tax=Polaromonas sp. TaxID=1869339 RepID=UPI003265E328